jgi:hypothetical protein
MSSSLSVALHGIGLLGPGRAHWGDARRLLREPSAWRCAATVVPAPARLAPTERRRAGSGVKASIAVADEACTMAGVDPAAPATVFTSSSGDPANCHAMCEALAQPVRTMSPTRFTNSVHNAAAGYWHIATHDRQASTSLCAFDASFAAGLLEAAMQCLDGGAPVLLVACDLPYPEPLNQLRKVSDLFALALLLAVPAAGDTTRLRLSLGAQTTASRCSAPALDTVRRTIPAARALPLLQALAGAGIGPVSLDALDGLSLQVELLQGA